MEKKTLEQAIAETLAEHRQLPDEMLMDRSIEKDGYYVVDLGHTDIPNETNLQSQETKKSKIRS